jgi:uncharacterized protein (TIGR03085 family)
MGGVGDLRSAYEELDDDSTGVAVSQVERAVLCDLFDEVGPGAPTLCTGWDAHHLAAHLVIREATPLGAVKTIRAKVSDEETDRLAAEQGFESLVSEIRGGPPLLSVFSLTQVDRLWNTLEFFVHHEDVRRAADAWEPRTLPGWAQDQLWSRLPFGARIAMRQSPVGVVLRRSDTGDTTVANKRAARVAVVGLPSELALFTFGRGQVAQVEFDGPTDRVDDLRHASFRL